MRRDTTEEAPNGLSVGIGVGSESAGSSPAVPEVAVGI